ncbi:MAG: polyprenyl synthetase family protein, partial [Candidatus Omnitrophica bacterium]|nr:polyprenyl synthetase family protein [Candidatus Omnitrophota bacterium]
VAGDVMYAMAIQAFLAVEEKKERKEKALRKFIEATIHTATGDFIELIYGINDIKNIKKEDILRVYDYKTAYYTFACPLAAGAILAGASQPQAEKLSRYGIYLGRAFQIKDDTISMFQEEKQTGKSSLSDLKEAKKTLIIWYAYHHTDKKNQNAIRRIFSKNNADRNDLLAIRKIVAGSGALEYAKKEISGLLRKSQKAIESSSIKPPYRALLVNYTQNILNV